MGLAHILVLGLFVSKSDDSSFSIYALFLMFDFLFANTYFKNIFQNEFYISVILHRTFFWQIWDKIFNV